MNIQIFKLNVKVFIVLAFFFVPSFYAADFQSPAMLGIGGAGHAGPVLSDSLYLNPAFLSFLPFRALNASYQKAQLSPGHAYTAGVSIMDGSSDALYQAGLGFIRYSFGDALHYAGSKALSRYFSVGLGVKVFFARAPFRRLLDFYASIGAVVGSWLLLSVMVDNIRQTMDALNPEREIVFGSKITLSDHFALYFDPQMPLVKGKMLSGIGYAAAAEIYTFSDFVLRGGVFYKVFQPVLTQKGSGYSMGLGWVAPKLGLYLSWHVVQEPVSVQTLGGQFFIFF